MKNKLKEIREKKGLTQMEVSAKAQVSLRAYQNYEANERIPNVYIAQSLSKAVGSRIDIVFPVN